MYMYVMMQLIVSNFFEAVTINLLGEVPALPRQCVVAVATWGRRGNPLPRRCQLGLFFFPLMVMLCVWGFADLVRVCVCVHVWQYCGLWTGFCWTLHYYYFPHPHAVIMCNTNLGKDCVTNYVYIMYWCVHVVIKIKVSALVCN